MSKLHYTITVYNKLNFPVEYSISFNNTNLGKLTVLQDGDYYWFPPSFNGSCLSTWVIKDIYRKLQKLNKKKNVKYENMAYK